MARLKEIVDFYFTGSGDFVLGSNNDFETTQNYSWRGLIQRVETRLSSKKGEWQNQRGIGAGLGDFVGRPNTAIVGSEIRNIIISELSQDDLLRAGEYEVEVFPIAINKVAIAVQIQSPREGGEVVLTFTYDLRDNRLIPRNV